jgi:hypothetical protein
MAKLFRQRLDALGFQPSEPDPLAGACYWLTFDFAVVPPQTQQAYVTLIEVLLCQQCRRLACGPSAQELLSPVAFYPMRGANQNPGARGEPVKVVAQKRLFALLLVNGLCFVLSWRDLRLQMA